ncbi:hypothetical protein L1987_01612 [Smallanthus sonchifolius]|uniref:Uncharacterized protein n=1 Tax=Smallanthus sonchifolius TaxID=185202 RepID=A0ACB9K5F7_9ASTR|nr:hypothetical protein L1987_01612 [Smallanthus sonchifolius]
MRSLPTNYAKGKEELIQRIDVNIKRDIVSAHLESGRSVDEEGIEDSFKILSEVSERVRTGLWVGDCFIYNNSSSRLNYCVGGEGVEENEIEEEFVDGQEVDQEEEYAFIAMDNDSSDGAVLVNGNDAEEEWGTNNAENPSA